MAQEQMLEISIKDLLEAGVHFGHQTSRWNPKMKRFIFGERNGIHIIDLPKTLKQLRDATNVIREVVVNHGSILFVGTKKAAKAKVREQAERAGEFYICERWLGGTLTNLPTIRQSIKKLDRIEKRIAQGSEGMTKKEFSLMSKEQIKLDKNLSGLRAMRKLPKLLIVVDPSKEDIAIAEARKLGIPVMALVDTNCDPDPIDYIIACNDDAQRSIKIILETLVDAIVEVKNEMHFASGKEDVAEVAEDLADGASDINEFVAEWTEAKKEE